MTTIAFKDGILAADTQLTTGSVKSLCRKIFQYSGGVISASCGEVPDQHIFMEWYLADRTKRVPKNLSKGFEIIVLDSEGAVAYNKDCIPDPITDPIYANGSGWQVARAGMVLGLGAIDSVKLAGEINTATNTLVDYYVIKTKKLILSRFPTYRKK